MPRTPAAAALAAAAALLPGCVFAVNTRDDDKLEKRLARIEQRLDHVEKRGPGPMVHLGGPTGPRGKVSVMRLGGPGAKGQFLHVREGGDPEDVEIEFEGLGEGEGECEDTPGPAPAPGGS
jgi:hypothetical protein